MTTRLKDETIILRDAIKDVLDSASEPLTTTAIAQHPAVSCLGLPENIVCGHVQRLYARKRKVFPLARVPHHGSGRATYAYYNPTVVQPYDYAQLEVNDVNSEEPEAPGFSFDPLELGEVQMSPPDAEPRVRLPAAKRITLEVSGVTIHIELAH